MLAEALKAAFEIAQELGIEIGSNGIVDSNTVAAKSRPEGMKDKVQRYDLLLASGGRLKKSEILKRI